ncbi:MAG: N-acetylmuramoyl-L-alanine amidase [Firmicutes bacterium]|uniref:N-acetylmuramoyl-L-alanine amidase n=1 Tax=Candidatus Colimorpha enterica TaxID=3083063 RepID=A0AAE3FG45_9BACT|nr:N-acetylmuramoyl-L-alanine amidase [Candidatus Colimorpha enterica]
MKKRRIFSLITALTFAAAPLVTAFHMRAAERTFMLDAGHGGSDSGAVYNGRLEKNDNLRITLAVGERLARSGERVLYTRTDDSTVDLTYRSTMANSAGATYFVSFHRNSASTVGRGVEVYYYTGLSAQSTAARMAAPVQDALVACGFHNRGVKQANFSVLRRTSMPAILVELAFINNEAENAKLDSEFDRIADAIASALLSFVGKTLTPATTQPPETEPPTTEPKATEPPATKPQITNPPETTPPATSPPETSVSETTAPETQPAGTVTESTADTVSEPEADDSEAASPDNAPSSGAESTSLADESKPSSGETQKPGRGRYFMIAAFLIIAAVCVTAAVLTRKRDKTDGR